MRVLCLLVGICNAGVIVFGSRPTQIIWVTLFALACHVMLDMVIDYGRTCAHREIIADVHLQDDLDNLAPGLSPQDRPKV